MKHTYIMFMLIMLCAFSACSRIEKKYVIGVSQCSEDSWRTKLKAELEQSTYFNEDIDVRILSADDNIKIQRQQIHDLVADNVDLLIVSPQQTASLSSAIKEATDKNIPVILFDRKSDVKEYTAFMGADNYAIGEMMGEFAANLLNGKGNIVEIGGEHGSSPAIERHKGFNDAIKRYPNLHIIGFAEGDWKQNSGEKAMNKILEELRTKNGADKIMIDCVFGSNDRMALGARAALERYAQAHAETVAQNTSHIIYLGVDALPMTGGGIEKVKEGELTASAIYPTHGDDLISLALAILKNEPYEKVNSLETSIVTAANASVLLMQYKEIIKQDKYIKKMHNRVDRILMEQGTERVLLMVIIFVVIIVCVFLVISVKMTRTKHILNQKLKEKNKELEKQKETAEQQRDELELQRDKLIEATMRHNQTTEEDGSEKDIQVKNEFLQKFHRCVEENLANSNLSVEDIGEEMCLSRVQLYRKIKTMTGKSPVELIREARLMKASHLLSDSSLSVSEVAYRVGFSAPSYFTKCYKDFFGKSPTDAR